MPQPAALCELLSENAYVMLTRPDPTPDRVCVDYQSAALVTIGGVFGVTTSTRQSHPASETTKASGSGDVSFRCPSRPS